MKLNTYRGRFKRLLTGSVCALTVMAGSTAMAQIAQFPSGAPQPQRWAGAPNWSGIWERDGDNVWDNRIPAGIVQVAPYNEEYTKRRADPEHQPKVGLFNSMPGVMNMLYPMDLQISPMQVTILTENGSSRRIFTDGRVHSEDTLSTPMGHSVGRWVRGELHVETCCISADTALPGWGPHSESMVIKERFYLRNNKTLVDEITVEDPEAFTQAWSTEKIWYRRPDWEPVTNPRDENDRDAAGDTGAPAEGGRARPNEN